MINGVTHPQSGPAARAAARQSDLLATFGALVVAILIAALAVTSLIQIQIYSDQEAAEVGSTAPSQMTLLKQAVERDIEAPPERLSRLANDLTRVRYVRRCRIERSADPAVAEGKAQAFVSHDPERSAAAAVTLRAQLHDASGRDCGSLTVEFGPEASGGVPSLIWTSVGLVAVAALGLYGALYRVARHKLRPIAFVRDNLLAYHSGAEKSLELLALHNFTGRESEAWNALVAFVREMQQELDAHRGRQAVEGSLQLVQSQSSRAILDALPTGVLRIDSESRLIYANGSAAQFLGIRQVEGENSLSALLPDGHLVETILALRHSVGGGGTDHKLDHGGGHTIVRLTPILAGGQNEDELVVTVQDISQLKDAERSREEFLAHITHELRTPLTNIRAYTETLNQDFFDDEQTRRECYNVIMSETRRLSKLVEDVLSASQIDAGVARLERVTVRIDQSLRKAVQEVQAQADAKSIELSLKIPSKTPPVSGDRFRLHQVWINLIGNAIKYTPKGGSVTVEAQGGDNLLRVRVSDTGIGIPADCQDKIFEKFFRVKDERVDAEEGTGLGLAISREIVRLHGGNIRVESDPGHGSTFVVELPQARDADVANDARASAADRTGE